MPWTKSCRPLPRFFNLDCLLASWSRYVEHKHFLWVSCDRCFGSFAGLLLSNYVAGMLLLWDKSVKLDDVISIGNSRTGEVKDITMRYMIIEDRNDVQFLVPHTQLINSTFENWTRTSRKVRLKLDIGVAYGIEYR